MVAIATVLITLIVCVSILVVIYMLYCLDNGVDMFSILSYGTRISKLEEEIKELKEKKE